MLVDIVTFAMFLVTGVVVFVVVKSLLRPQASGAAGRKSGPFAAPRRPGRVVRTFAAAIPQLPTEIATIEHDLRRAGNYDVGATQRYLAVRNGLILSILLLAIGAAAAVIRSPAQTVVVMVAGAIAAVLCYGVPRLYLHWLASARVQRIQYGLPDALDIITMCLTGGLPLQDALQRVSQEIGTSHPDVAQEFEIIRRQADAGSMGLALRQFAQRIDVPDIKSLAALVGQTERLGTNVATAVKDYADSVRRAHRQRAEERANKMTVQMLFPVMFCLTPPVFILLCGPPILEMREYFLREENRAGGGQVIGVPRSLDDIRVRNPQPLRRR